MNFAVTAIGRDRPGIVAAITEELFQAGGNVDDSQMSILHGHFAVMLIVSLPGDDPETTANELRSRLEKVGTDLGLDGITVSPVTGLDRGAAPTHVVTVYGADRPGIVRDTTGVLAEHSVNITDLRTRRTGNPEAPLYTLMVEVSVPPEPRIIDDLTLGLQQLAEKDQVEAHLSELDLEVI